MNEPAPSSPHWDATLKLIVGLTMASLGVILLVYFRSIIGPLLLALVTTYLLHPVVKFLSSRTKLSWRGAVNITYVVVLALFLGLSTATGVVIVQQIQSLIRILQDFLNNLPETIKNLQTQTISIGPFVLDLSQYLDLNTLGTQIIQTIQPLIGRAGTIVSTFATGAASTVGWAFFVILVSYFTLSDIGKIPNTVRFINIPGYGADLRRLSRELGYIWNAFLRGQLIIVALVFLVYTIFLSTLGVRFAIALAILAGLARFVPYAGPVVFYIVTFLVTFFQSGNYLNLDHFWLSALAIGIAFIMDQIFDNLVSPRILGDTLGINPGAVLVVAILAANIIGIIGLVLAAPMLATVQLVGTYVMRKLLDLDPWPEAEKRRRTMGPSWFSRIFRRLQAWWRMRKGK